MVIDTQTQTGKKNHLKPFLLGIGILFLIFTLLFLSTSYIEFTPYNELSQKKPTLTLHNTTAGA